MTRYIAGRVAQALAVILAVATLTFFLIHLAPGDPISGRSESAYANPEVLASQRALWGFDQPLPVQFVRYLANVARGDFGRSPTSGRPVLESIGEALPHTVGLAFAALLIDFTVGILLGAWQGARAHGPGDRVATAATLIVYSMPVFWLGVLLQAGLGQWLPQTGLRDPALYASLSPAGQAWDLARHTILPALALGLVGAAGTARYQRAQVLEVVGRDFVRTARAKGLAERAVLLRHALRNAVLPVITLFGLSLPGLLSGAVLVESVFAWPGIGLLSVDAIGRRDYFTVTGIAIVSAVLVVAGSLLADGLSWIADPRTRESA